MEIQVKDNTNIEYKKDHFLMIPIVAANKGYATQLN